jgi:hypothetical protein
VWSTPLSMRSSPLRDSRATSLAHGDSPRSSAYSSDREHRFHAMVNGAWSRQLESTFLRQVFTISQALRV